MPHSPAVAIMQRALAAAVETEDPAGLADVTDERFVQAVIDALVTGRAADGRRVDLVTAPLHLDQGLDPDHELVMLGAMTDRLESVDAAARRRVVGYLASRYGLPGA